MENLLVLLSFIVVLRRERRNWTNGHREWVAGHVLRRNDWVYRLGLNDDVIS